ncbi:MAG TPA: hypothetical protein VNF91_10430 [Candidatus Acidoferrum sp.]|jgi:hypothetical protein|nr:hypothetical protein [Candidatus Acidoferrum sp.]
MQVKDVAYARSGDKGDIVNVGVIAFDDAAFARLTRTLTPERIKSHFGDWVKGDVDVFPMPNLNAFNLLLHNALGGGATKTLRYDVTGKAFSTAVLRMELAE